MADDELIEDLRRVLNTIDATSLPDPELAKAAFGWNRIDAEFAQLVFDSESEDTERARGGADADLVLRSDGNEPRRLTFSSHEITIEIEIGSNRVIGQVLPPQAATIEVHRPDAAAVRVDDADEFGVFRIMDFRPGPTALVARALDGSWSVRTEWTVT